MPKFQVQIVETDDFGWYNRLEDTIEFRSEEVAKAFQKHFNETNDLIVPEKPGNYIVARKPIEIVERKNADQV